MQYDPRFAQPHQWQVPETPYTQYPMPTQWPEQYQQQPMYPPQSMPPPQPYYPGQPMYPPQPYPMPQYPMYPPPMPMQINVSQAVNVAPINAQPSFAVRAIYFIFVGWWLALLWLSVALTLLCTIVLAPVAFIMLAQLPKVMTLQR